jgi:hypothetical protein
MPWHYLSMSDSRRFDGVEYEVSLNKLNGFWGRGRLVGESDHHLRWP